MAKVYYDKDADLDLIKSKVVAIIGYGIQGRGQALCLRDSGVSVVVSELEGTPNYELAKKDGFMPVAVEVAAQKASVIQILTQDHVQAKVYNDKIAPHMKKGKALCFSHGFNIRFKAIKPAKKLDVFMVAPKGPGALVRRMFEEGKGVPCLVAVHQNASGAALQLALSYAKAIGGTRMGVIETTFAEETETDLFGEQVVLCGGVSELVKAGFDTLVEAGYQPEIAYFEVLHELKLITDLIYEVGISGMRRKVSNTACYGDVTRGPRIIDARTRKTMQKILKEIKSGKFAKEWIAENESGRKNFDRLLQEGDKHPIEGVGKALREMMPWMKH
jgi:ketol-acid reductoisomerase